MRTFLAFLVSVLVVIACIVGFGFMIVNGGAFQGDASLYVSFFVLPTLFVFVGPLIANTLFPGLQPRTKRTLVWVHAALWFVLAAFAVYMFALFESAFGGGSEGREFYLPPLVVVLGIVVTFLQLRHLKGQK